MAVCAGTFPLGRSIESLSGEERATHYGALSREAIAHAQQAASDDHRARLLDIASKWAALADEVDRQERREAEIVAVQAA